MPPETFPGLEISPKCVSGRGSTRTPLTVLPRLSSWIMGRGEEGKRQEGKEGKREEGKGRKEREEPQTESLATALRKNVDTASK